MNILSVEQINHIKNSHGSTYRKITITYKDLARGQAYFVEKSFKGKDRKEKQGKELTVATASMSDYTQTLVKQGILRKDEMWKDEKKCRAIRYILEEIGWIECLDADWKKGVAKRWAIGKNYYRYNEFINYIGKKTLERIRAKGMASIEDWDSMEQSA